MPRLPFMATILAGAFLAAPAAQASEPPTRPVLITLSSIDGNVLRGNDAGFALRVKADHDYAADSRSGELLTWERHGIYWAGMTRNVIDGRTETVAYFGPFRTVKGDTNGARLAAFEKHWPGARVFSAGSGWNVQPRGSEVLFAFNLSGRLVGASLGWGEVMFPGTGVDVLTINRDGRNVCFYPECSWDSSPYEH